MVLYSICMRRSRIHTIETINGRVLPTDRIILSDVKRSEKCNTQVKVRIAQVCMMIESRRPPRHRHYCVMENFI